MTGRATDTGLRRCWCSSGEGDGTVAMSCVVIDPNSWRALERHTIS